MKLRFKGLERERACRKANERTFFPEPTGLRKKRYLVRDRVDIDLQLPSKINIFRKQKYPYESERTNFAVALTLRVSNLT